MENDFFLNAGMAPLLHFDPSSMPTWQSTPLNSSSPDCFWEKSTDQTTTSHFDSAMSSMVNSPVASNVSNESFAVRELIGKLGTVTEAKRDSVPDFAADPGFAARAARFSCFGSRSFNSRPGPDPILSRVSSSPSLKEHANSNDDHSTLSEQVNPSAAPNPRKRKAANSKGKAKVIEAAEKANAKRGKSSEDEKTKTEEEPRESPKPPEPLKDYIHVRARRGQATDSHSLAERVRREKISERMKLLQDLVPGCNKVTGKALMLDEIINYVQSLQRQVEFLSMKLSSVNTRLDNNNLDPQMSKDVFQANNNNSMSHPIFPLDSSAQAIFSHQIQPLHCSIDALDSSLCHLNGFNDLLSQYQAFGEDDLQSIVQMGFGANPNRDTSSLHPQGNHGSNQASHMKIEL